MISRLRRICGAFFISVLSRICANFKFGRISISPTNLSDTAMSDPDQKLFPHPDGSGEMLTKEEWDQLIKPYERKAEVDQGPV